MGRQLDLGALDIVLSPILSLVSGDSVAVSISTVWREERGLNLDDWLLVCADAAILEVHDGNWRFSHDKLREQLIADLDEDQLQLIRRHVQKATYSS